MPKAQTREGEHVVYTDHTIRRRPGGPVGAGDLELFPGMTATDREWALAEPGKRLAVLERLAARSDADAAALYERVLRQEPAHATAQANLAIYRMQAGRVPEALALWSRAFTANPAMLSAGLNLAMGQIQIDAKDDAVRTLRRVLRFHPDSARARELLRSLL